MSVKAANPLDEEQQSYSYQFTLLRAGSDSRRREAEKIAGDIGLKRSNPDPAGGDSRRRRPEEDGLLPRKQKKLTPSILFPLAKSFDFFQ